MSDSLFAAIIAASAAVGSGIVTAVATLIGIRLTAKTSMAASARLAEVSERNNASSLKSSCESKIAEVRIQWNDDLRVALARFGAAIASAVAALSAGTDFEDNDKQYWYVYVVLKLNLNDADDKKLVSLLSEMMTYANRMLQDKKDGKPPAGPVERENFQTLFTDYSKASSAILKREWDRAKLETRQAWTMSTLEKK